MTERANLEEQLRLSEKYKDYRMEGAKAAIEGIFAELKQGAAQR